MVRPFYFLVKLWVARLNEPGSRSEQEAAHCSHDWTCDEVARKSSNSALLLVELRSIRVVDPDHPDPLFSGHLDPGHRVGLERRAV